MDFKQAIIKSMRSYYKGLSPKELQGSTGKRPKFDKKYFDKVGREYDIEPVDLKTKSKGY